MKNLKNNIMTYCIVVKREIEDDYVYHQDFDHVPTRDEILTSVLKEDLNYDDNYGKIEYWRVD